MSVSWTKVQAIVRELPGTEESSAHGRSGFKVGKKFLLAFNEEENAIGIRISMDERELLMEQAPEIYYVTDHYRPYPAVLVSLARVSEKELRQLIERRWRDLAPTKLIKAQSVAPPIAKKSRAPKLGKKGPAMTPAGFRKLALGFPSATEGAHGGHPDFRVGNKLFASLGYPGKEFATIMLTRDEQLLFVEMSPEMFEPVKGGWGLKGSTTVILKHAKPAVVKSALLAAWRRKAPKTLIEKSAASPRKRRAVKK
jgi:hypothetical protein